ncbi:MAG: anaerobic ribonucleoside-triphosphate reductase activating protein [Clostridia bacterium]|nr:anaerobic ribonucleoside-triphosphate reductase activating protein [Clostridia bacterium]
MNIAGLQKLTLLDFPGYTACTVFTSGCNFRCPFCHNSDLLSSKDNIITESEFFDFLTARKGKLDGVCISGGEPLLQSDIVNFIKKIRELGFLIKLDTNGSNFEKLKDILQGNLVDYVAMDIKNIPEKYHLSCGVNVNIENIKKSVELIKNSNVNYEFRTTVVKELNDKQDFKTIASWLKGSKGYYLQCYRESEKVLNPIYTAYTESEMKDILNLIKQTGLEKVYLRGI